MTKIERAAPDPQARFGATEENGYIGSTRWTAKRSQDAKRFPNLVALGSLEYIVSLK